jgi:hypothetical protein
LTFEPKIVADNIHGSIVEPLSIANTCATANPGAIAGATIANVALLAVIAFMIWFFGFHRRKAAAQRDQQ